MSAVSHWLNTTLHVWRHTLTPDGSGGFTETWADRGSIKAKVDQSSAEERTLAQQAGADHTHNIYGEPDVDVKRNDRLAASSVDVENLVAGDVYYDVTSTTTPSSPRYLKCVSERIEVG